MAPNVTRAASLRPNPNPIDTDVKIPEAVKRAAAAAEAAQAAAYPGQTPEELPAPANPNPNNITIAAPSPAPVPQPAPVTPVGNEPAPQPAPQPAPSADETWEHKFNSEKGRRVKLEEQNRQLLDRLGSLENIVQDLRAAPPAPPPAPPTPTRLITETEESEFGAEMLDVMGRRAREIVSPEVAELRAQLASLENKINGTASRVTRNARQEMLGALDDKMPTWREVNDMQEFKSWLALPDPYFGVIRHSALLQAFEQNDTPRVLNFFKGFVSELAASTPAGEVPVNDPPAPQPAKPSLETLAAPGRARTPAQVNAPAEKQIITTADINAFYAAKARGAYNGREAEFAQLEQELFRAQREGRVRAS